MQCNTQETNAQELFELLQSLVPFIEQKIEMYALGGTALTILGIKKSTLDIDINVPSQKQHNYLCRVFEKIGFKRVSPLRWLTQERSVFDLFTNSNIMGTQLLDDCAKMSQYIQSFGNINLYTHSLYDIIITKLARGDERDFIDIKHLFEHEKIVTRTLVERYQKTMDQSIVGQYKQKLLDLIEIKFGQWKYPQDHKLMKEVQLWQEH